MFQAAGCSSLLSWEEVTLGQLFLGALAFPLERGPDHLASVHPEMSLQQSIGPGGTTGDSLAVVGAQVGGGQVPAYLHCWENLLCLGLPRNRRYQPCSRPPPSAHGQKGRWACSQGRAGGWRSIPACSGGCQLLCGAQPLPGSQTNGSGVATPPLFGAVTQRAGRVGGGRWPLCPVNNALILPP